MKKIILASFIVLLNGCQAMAYGTAADFNKLSVGMDKAQVVQIMGEPSSIAGNADRHEDTFTYRRMPNVVSWGPSTYIAVFRDNKLVRYGNPDLITPATP